MCPPLRATFGGLGACATERFWAASSRQSVSPMGGFKSDGPERTGRSRSAVPQQQRGGQLSHKLLTLTAALTAELDVGLMALTRRTPSGGGRLHTLQRSPRKQ